MLVTGYNNRDRRRLIDMASTTKCNYCGKTIGSSDDPRYISKTGKCIPLDVDLAGEILGFHDSPAREQEYSIRY